MNGQRQIELTRMESQQLYDALHDWVWWMEQQGKGARHYTVAKGLLDVLRTRFAVEGPTPWSSEFHLSPQEVHVGLLALSKSYYALPDDPLIVKLTGAYGREFEARRFQHSAQRFGRVEQYLTGLSQALAGRHSGQRVWILSSAGQGFRYVRDRNAEIYSTEFPGLLGRGSACELDVIIANDTLRFRLSSPKRGLTRSAVLDAISIQMRAPNGSTYPPQFNQINSGTQGITLESKPVELKMVSSVEIGRRQLISEGWYDAGSAHLEVLSRLVSQEPRRGGPADRPTESTTGPTRGKPVTPETPRSERGRTAEEPGTKPEIEEPRGPRRERPKRSRRPRGGI